MSSLYGGPCGVLTSPLMLCSPSAPINFIVPRELIMADRRAALVGRSRHARQLEKVGPSRRRTTIMHDSLSLHQISCRVSVDWTRSGERPEESPDERPG